LLYSIREYIHKSFFDNTVLCNTIICRNVSGDTIVSRNKFPSLIFFFIKEHEGVDKRENAERLRFSTLIYFN